MAVVGPSFTCIGGVLLVLPSHITDLGLTTMQASSLVVIATLMAPFTSPFIWVGMPLSAWAYDATGSYAPAFAGLILALLASMVAVALLRLPGDAEANVGKVRRAGETI